jgi:hypothetical protein
MLKPIDTDAVTVPETHREDHRNLLSGYVAAANRGRLVRQTARDAVEARQDASGGERGRT